MTTDNPRELRAIAERIEMECDTIIRHGLDAMPAEDQADTIALINDRLALAEYVLATVRDDDGEEQDSETTGWYDGLSVAVVRSLNYVQVSIMLAGGQSMAIPFKTFTRGQFRDLCRGLGIEVPG